MAKKAPKTGTPEFGMRAYRRRKKLQETGGMPPKPPAPYKDTKPREKMKDLGPAKDDSINVKKNKGKRKKRSK